MSWNKKAGAAKVAVQSVKTGAPPSSLSSSVGSDALGGRYRVWNVNLDPKKAVAVRRRRIMIGIILWEEEECAYLIPLVCFSLFPSLFSSSLLSLSPPLPSLVFV